MSGTPLKVWRLPPVRESLRSLRRSRAIGRCVAVSGSSSPVRFRLLARALPDQAFPASNRVIPLLASAIRTSGDEYAIVIAESVEDRRAAQDRLEAMGFKVVGTDRSVARLADAISQSPGIDLAYVQGGVSIPPRPFWKIFDRHPGRSTRPSCSLSPQSTCLPTSRSTHAT